MLPLARPALATLFTLSFLTNWNDFLWPLYVLFNPENLTLSPGLGLLPNVIIDQHFAERGRFGRLIGAVAHNPRVLGMGIDEDTAAVVEGDVFRVIGSGAVYVVDGTDVSYCNVAEARSDKALSMHDVRVHVLSDGDSFDLKARRPVHPRA